MLIKREMRDKLKGLFLKRLTECDVAIQRWNEKYTGFTHKRKVFDMYWCIKRVDREPLMDKIREKGGNHTHLFTALKAIDREIQREMNHV